MGASGCCADRFTLKPKWRGHINRAPSATVMPTRLGTGGCFRNQASRSAEAIMVIAAPARVASAAITSVRVRTTDRTPRARPGASDIEAVES
jgi:hypothetical protein